MENDGLVIQQGPEQTKGIVRMRKFQMMTNESGRQAISLFPSLIL
jgi:hypothetical protein